jgi:hypothetical protein
MSTSKFHTIVQIPEFSDKIDYRKASMLMGSCFTENIGAKMEELKYNVDINPFGILYNPVSVANGLQILLEERKFENRDLTIADGLHHSFYHHGRFSDPDEKTVLKKINERIRNSSEFLKQADFLFLTFGTAWVYRYKKTGEVVSNCHKIKAESFERERLSIHQITNIYKDLLARLKKQNPKLKVVFTVSPVRHWKDGAVENQRSKATLLLTIDQIIRESGTGTCSYFPSYEIVMDELRDYRFYAEDMIHIADAAVNHIWEKFEKVLIETESRDLSKKVKSIMNAMNHRPFNKITREHLKFIEKIIQETRHLKTQYPYLKLENELEFFLAEKSQIEKEFSKQK